MTRLWVGSCRQLVLPSGRASLGSSSCHSGVRLSAARRAIRAVRLLAAHFAIRAVRLLAARFAIRAVRLSAARRAIRAVRLRQLVLPSGLLFFRQLVVPVGQRVARQLVSPFGLPSLGSSPCHPSNVSQLHRRLRFLAIECIHPHRTPSDTCTRFEAFPISKAVGAACSLAVLQVYTI